ncbi:MAG: hypothetical protein NTV86_16585 [Planctomycetota bacterium]|nr:hypothetical protein [Planctomycetota bacterium]
MTPQTDHVAANRPAPAGGLLARRLQATGRLALATETARAGAGVLAGLIALALAALAADILLALPPWGRIAADAVFVLGALTGGVYVAWVARCHAGDARRAARLVETRMGVTDSRFINAVQLALSAPGGGGLVGEVLARGERAAAGIVPSKLIDTSPLRRALTALAVAAAALGGSCLPAPGAFRAAFPRFLHPRADLAAFTLVRFRYGQPASILVGLSGPDTPDRADVVFADADGPVRAPMARREDGRFVLTIERAELSRDFHIDTPAGRSGTFRLVVLPVPRVQELAVRYEYPAYTGWPAAGGPVEASGIGALEGTTAVVRVRASLPLADGLIELIPAEAPPPAACAPGAACPVPATAPASAPAPAKTVRVAMTPTAEDARVVEGRLPIRFNGRFRIRLQGLEGVPAADSPEGPLTCTPDAWPKIQITDPTGLVVAPEDWKVPVTMVASDDVAVRQISVTRGVNGWGPATKEVAFKAAGPTYATATEIFDLAALGARGGDVISVFATARDNCPSAEHFTDTPVVVIHVITKQEYIDLARMTYRMEQIMAEAEEFRAKLAELEAERKKLEEEFDALAKKIEAAGGKPSAADLKKLDELVGWDARQRAKRQPLYDFETDYAQLLTPLAAKLAEGAQGAEELRGELAAHRAANAVAANAQSHAARAAERLRLGRQAEEPAEKDVARGMEDLGRIQQADKLVALVERVQAAAYQQRELAERLGQFRNREQLSEVEQIRARRMAEEQAQLEQDLAATLKQMDAEAAEAAEAANVLPKMSASVKDLAQAIRELKVTADQADAARLAQAGQGRYAWTACDSAATKLESLMNECNGGGQMMGQAEQDCRLQLMMSNVAQALKQLSLGRGIPGLGKKEGGEGGGTYGSRANMRVMGPHRAGGGASDVGGPHAANRGTGSGTGPGRVQRPDAPETLTPGSGPVRQIGGGGSPGVPVRFRGLAEAYFRRLADESK